MKQLREHQDRVLSVMSRASALLDAARADTVALGQRRWEVARQLRAYQIHKHRYVFDPIIAAGGDPDKVQLAHRLKADCIAMGERFRDYLLRWSATSVADHWDDYRPAALAMIAALRTHLDRERRAIAGLLPDDTKPRPRPAPAPAPPRRLPTLRY